MLEQVKDQGVSVQFQAQESSAENIKLREEVRGLKATLTSKEAAVERYRAQLDDQTLLVQSLHAERTASGEQSGYTGSLMNEIEHMMMAQIGDEPDGSVGGGAEAEPPPSPTAPIATPDRATPNTSGGSGGGGGGSDHFRVPSEVVAPPPSFDDAKGDTVGNQLSQPASPSRPKGHTYVLQDRLQVYAAASANHLSGRKVITPEMAAEMDVSSLQKTAAALQDLIDTRSSRLINALTEKVWLEADIEMKNGVVEMLVERAAANASPRRAGGRKGA